MFVRQCAGILFAGLLCGLWAQDVISLRAGLVERAEGHVQLSDITPEDLPVDRKLHMTPGQYMRTFRGRAEIQLFPDNYCRVYGQSEIELVSDRFDDIQVRLLSGTLMLDLVKGDVGRDYSVRVLVGDMEIRPLKHGEYMLHRPDGGSPELSVYKGKAEVRRSGQVFAEVSSDEAVLLAGQPTWGEILVEPGSFQDRLLTWSRRRRAELMDPQRKLGVDPALAEPWDPTALEHIGGDGRKLGQ